MQVRYPPLKMGISAILARYPMKTRQMGALPPSAILSRKGIARYGGVSRTGPLRTQAEQYSDTILDDLPMRQVAQVPGRPPEAGSITRRQLQGVTQGNSKARQSDARSDRSGDVHACQSQANADKPCTL